MIRSLECDRKLSRSKKKEESNTLGNNINKHHVDHAIDFLFIGNFSQSNTVFHFTLTTLVTYYLWFLLRRQQTHNSRQNINLLLPSALFFSGRKGESVCVFYQLPHHFFQRLKANKNQFISSLA